MAAASTLSARNVIFGQESSIHSSKYYHNDDIPSNLRHRRPPPPLKGTWREFFFGFMYEECENDNDDLDRFLYSSTIESNTRIWNPINAALSCALLLSSCATAIPVALAGAMSDTFADDPAFAPRAAAAAVLGTSIGKFVNGPVVDLMGARRVSIVYAMAVSASLGLLACATTVQSATHACFLVEFFSSVQWPCVIVVLATHYRGNASGMYEGGIYLTALAGRVGALAGIPTYALLLRHWHNWRIVAWVGAWLALVASSVTYWYVQDAPNKTNDPQNPIDDNLLSKWFPEQQRQQRRPSLCALLRMAQFVIQSNVVPSMKHILFSGTFWIVALAHSGGSMVRTSERVIAAYLYETSNGTLSESRAAGLSVFLSIGTASGLVLAGSLFASRGERDRKWLVLRLYVLTIASVYILSLLVIPSLRQSVDADLITVFQVMAVATAGFGIAVQVYHVPSLVGATFGCDRGLFASYLDGVAYGIASLTWGVVGTVVQQGGDNGGGWAYGWAAIALLLIPSAILMVEFMEHYFCRDRHAGSYETYETILFA